MYDFRNPVLFEHLLNQAGLIEDFYRSIQQDDIGEAVVIALKTFRINNIPIIKNGPKSTDLSYRACHLGDQALINKNYRNAFEMYNCAIRCAPEGSDAMLDAYFGRSRLLFAIGTCPSECIADIDTCLSWKNLAYEQRLQKMKADSLKKIKTVDPRSRNAFVDNFFNIKNKHPRVPSVSSDVDFIIESGQSKVVARHYIPTGTLVALESAYVGILRDINKNRSCYYCHRISLNLIPCNSCTAILFCSPECRTHCWEEFHNVQCHIISIFDDDKLIGPSLPFMAALKLKNTCSWDEFITISQNLGLKEMEDSMINEVYDVNNKSSILKFNNDNIFVFGDTFNALIVISVIILHLEEMLPSFFPREKDEAIRAMGRVLVHIHKSTKHAINVGNMAKAAEMDGKGILLENHGIFSFTSKLKHSCDPNLYLTGLNNKVVLITLKPLKKGEELTISYIGHWYDHIITNRSLYMWMNHKKICRCKVCVNNWDHRTVGLPNAKMTAQQNSSFDKWMYLFTASHISPVNFVTMYKETFRCIGELHNLPNTQEYRQTYSEMRGLIESLKYSTTKNCTV